MDNSDSRDLPEGFRLLDRYVILDRIGGGGMATIYRADDERLQRVVCAKVLRSTVGPEGSSSGNEVYHATYTHFHQEALALSRLQHPNTLRIFDFGYLPDSECPFQISEYLEGGTLEDRVRAQGRLSLEECVSLLERLVGAVEEAHEHGITHRDIKPSNILFAKVGGTLIPKLADFGIARADLHRPGHADTTDTVSSVTLFSPRWAAPEQLAGTSEGAPTDVYALGLLMTFALVGKPLFEGRDVRPTFQDRVSGDDLVERLLAMQGVPTDLRPVLLGALAANPDMRYQRPQHFLEHFRGALLSGTGSTSSSRPAPASTPPLLDLVGANARSIEVAEGADLSTVLSGEEVRFRVTFLPSAKGASAFRIHLKGLSCFVRLLGGRSTPALHVDADAIVEFVSSNSSVLGQMGCSFGTSHPTGRGFRIGSGEMVLPSGRGNQAIALYFGRDQDVMVVYRHA